MWQSRWIDDDQIRRKRTPSFPSNESLVSRNAQRGGRKFSFHFCTDGDTIETVFRTFISVNQLSLHGAVSYLDEEQDSCQTSTRRPVVAEKSEPALLIMTPTTSIEILAQENLSSAEVQRTSGNSSTNQINWNKFVLMQDSWNDEFYAPFQ